MGAEERGPFGLVEGSDGQPPVDGHGVRLLQERFERIDRHREAEVLADDRLHRHESQDVALTVEHGSSAIPLFDRHGQLDQGLAVNLTDAGDHSADHAVLQSPRIADGHDVLPLLDRVGVPEFEWFKVLGLDANHGKIHRLVGCVDFRDVESPRVRRRHNNGPRFANHVQVGRNQSILRDGETGAQARAFPVAPHDRDDDDRVANPGGQVGDGHFAGRGCRRLGGGVLFDGC